MYTIKEVAEKLHVSIATLRAWELRGYYKVARFGRLGIRMFNDADISTLIKVKLDQEARFPSVIKARATRAVNAEKHQP